MDLTIKYGLTTSLNASICFIDALISLIDQITLKFFYQQSIISKILQLLSGMTVQVYVAV